MIVLSKYRFFSLITMLVVMLLFGCESNFKEVQKSNFSEFVPSGEAEKINFKYTDSGRIKVVLLTPLMKEYTNVDFPFTEFPKGIDITLYDDKGKKTTVLADYATSFKRTDLIDLKGNVKITSQDGQVLETDQLYFDQRNDWFFTDKPFKITDAKGVSIGEGVDFSKDFKVIHSQKNSGEIESTD